MKVVHDWLKDYLQDALPSVEMVEKLLTFHAFEIEGTERIGSHDVIDIKILPDRSSDCLSHRGIAREIATLANVRLTYDPLMTHPDLPNTDSLKITIHEPKACDHFDLALIEGVKIGPSPEWLADRLRALGQRSINNVVDATNYVMLSLGQPLHAYDADKLKKDNGVWHFGVRFARDDEKITTLTGEEYILDPSVLVISNEADGEGIGLAGIKGGKNAEVDQNSTTIILEAAHFDAVITRKSSQKLKLQTDASKRFENNVSTTVAPYALSECAKLITEIAGGEIKGYAHKHPLKIENKKVSVTLRHINALLGLSLTVKDVESILLRLGFWFESNGEGWNVVAPHERTDINIAEDVIEEVGRVYGYEHVASVVPEAVSLTEINARHYYSERIRNTLITLGFSEVITSSFRKKDEIKLLNALATDKEYLRSSLRKNIEEALDRNMPNADLLGLRRVTLFEIGTVFHKMKGGGISEHVSLAFGARTKQQGYVPKDDVVITEAIEAIQNTLGIKIDAAVERGVCEMNLTECIGRLPAPLSYDAYEKSIDAIYKPFSNYPFVSRDIALWVSEGITSSEVEATINAAAGDLLVRTTLFDEFKKDERISYAFRLVFQSHEKTLTDFEINGIMEHITEILKSKGFEVR